MFRGWEIRLDPRSPREMSGFSAMNCKGECQAGGTVRLFHLCRTSLLNRDEAKGGSLVGGRALDLSQPQLVGRFTNHRLPAKKRARGKTAAFRLDTEVEH